MFRIHGDPRTNVNNPSGPDRDRGASRGRLDEWMEHWQQHGFGYCTVQLAEPRTGHAVRGTVVGFSGVRHETWRGVPVLNLYYRFSPEHWGRGYATEVARHAVAWATATRPHLPVVARTKPENVGSQRTAESAGLVRRPEIEGDDGTGHAVILVNRWPVS